MRKLLLLAMVSFAGLLSAQNPGHQIDRVQNQFGQGVPNPSVRVCTEPAVGSPCTNLATIYTCNAINGSCIGPNPLTGDQYGNYNFFAPNNVPYHLEFTGPSLIVPTILYYVYLAGIGGGGGGAVPCGVLYDVQINDPLGTFGCDTGVFTENPTTHTVSDTIVVATQQLQTGSSGITGTLLFNHSNGSSINASLILGLDSTFSTSYGLDFPDTAALGALTVTSLTPGTDGRLPTAWVPSSSGGGSPCGGVFDVQINNPLGDFGCDPGIFQENPATHTVTDTIVQATQQIQVSDPTHTGVINFGSSNGTSIVSNFLLGLSPTFSTTSGGYGVDVPDSPAIGTLAISSLTPGSDGRLPTVWSTAPISAISCENVPTLQGCNANYPATTSDIQYTLYPASDDYVFKAPPNSSYGSSAVVQDCLMTNLGSPSQNSCACTHTYSGTTVTISCKLPHVFPGDSIVAFGAIICGLGCGQWPQFTDSQSNIYTQLDPETTGASGGASVDGITVGVAGNYSDTVTATFLGIGSEYYSSLHVIELRGVTGITAHGGTSNTSGPVTSFPGVTTTGGQAILGFSFDNTYGAPGCGYSAGTGYQMINQDAITNGSFGDEAIIETNNGTYTPTITRNAGCAVGGGTAQTLALAYTGTTTGSDILWPQRLRFSTLVVGGDFDPLQSGTGLFSPDGQRVSALTFGTGLTLSGATLSVTGGGVGSIQFKNSGTNYGSPMTGAGSLNCSGCTFSGTTPNFTITTSGGGAAFPINAQTSNYQVLVADFSACKTIEMNAASFLTVTLVASTSQPSNGACIWVYTYNATGVVSIVPSGQNLNGNGESLTVFGGGAALIVSDGTNYFGWLVPWHGEDSEDSGGSVVLGGRYDWVSTLGTQNTFIGPVSGINTGTNNVFVGYEAGFSMSGGANYNTLVGALTASGGSSCCQTFVGYNSGNNSLGTWTAIGYQVGSNNYAGTGSISIGTSSAVGGNSSHTSNYLNIGNFLIGDMANGSLIVGASGGTGTSIASNACGSTTQGTVASGGNNFGGEVTVGTTAVTSCAVSFSSTMTSKPVCVCSPESGAVVGFACSSSTTKVTATATSGFSSTKWNYICSQVTTSANPVP